MAGPEGISAYALSVDVGVSQGTLSRWLRDARRVSAMGDQQSNDGKRSRKSFSAEEKFHMVMMASRLEDHELGAFLREQGIYEADLKEWRVAAQAALTPMTRRAKKKTPEAKRIKELETDLRRKEKALAEVTAILALEKRIAEIWGDEDESTPTRSET